MKTKRCTWPSGIHTVRKGKCSVCGAEEASKPVRTEHDPVLEELATLEFTYKSDQLTVAGFGDDRRAPARMADTKGRIYALLGSLSEDQLIRYREYRKS